MSSPLVLKKGVYILFDDGTQIRKPEIDVGTEVSNSKYRRFDLKAAFLIDEELFEKLSSNRITDIKLFEITQEFDEKYGDKVKSRFNCLVNDTFTLIKTN